MRIWSDVLNDLVLSILYVLVFVREDIKQWSGEDYLQLKNRAMGGGYWIHCMR